MGKVEAKAKVWKQGKLKKNQEKKLYDKSQCPIRPLKKAKIINHVVKTLGSVKDVSPNENSDEDQLLEASLEDESGGQPEDDLVADEQKLKLLRLLEEIEPREAKIMKMHYGLDGNEPLGLREIGNKLGLTRERIRQIQRDVLTRLYEYMEE